jgi:hypothetical protein
MNNRDQFYNTRLETGLAQAAIAADAVQTGLSIALNRAVAISVFLDVVAYTSGDIKIQDIQFADDAAFTQNVDTYTSDDILLKNDRSDQLTSAIDQTLLAAVGKSKISIENRALNNQKFMRVRTVTANTASLTAGVYVIIGESETPVVQA